MLIDLLVLAILIGVGLAAGTWVPSRGNAIFPEDLVLEFGGENWYLTSRRGRITIHHRPPSEDV